MSKTLVSARTIRNAFQTGALDAKAVVKGTKVSTNSVLGEGGDASRVRGRINPLFVEAYRKANPGHDYAEKKVTTAADEKTVTLPVTKVSKSGATLKRPVEVSLREARRLAGQPKGRFGAASLDKAARAFEAARDAKVTAPKA